MMIYGPCGCPECQAEFIKQIMPKIDEAEIRRKSAAAEVERAEREWNRTHWPCGKLK